MLQSNSHAQISSRHTTRPKSVTQPVRSNAVPPTHTQRTNVLRFYTAPSPPPVSPPKKKRNSPRKYSPTTPTRNRTTRLHARRRVRYSISLCSAILQGRWSSRCSRRGSHLCLLVRRAETGVILLERAVRRCAVLHGAVRRFLLCAETKLARAAGGRKTRLPGACCAERKGRRESVNKQSEFCFRDGDGERCRWEREDGEARLVGRVATGLF